MPFTSYRSILEKQSSAVDGGSSGGFSGSKAVCDAAARFLPAALFLAALGLYGVLTYAVTQRPREIGIRIALGAERRAVIKLVVAQGLRLAGTGVAIGIVAAMFARSWRRRCLQVGFPPGERHERTRRSLCVMNRRMKMTSARLCIIAALACIAAARGQSPLTIDLTGVGKDPKWKIVGRTTSIVDIKGKHALKLSEGDGMGVVWLDGYDFADGAIEVDMLGRSQPVQGSFLGVAFRVADGQTHDAVYFRPFNFRAADPVRHSHAVQYVSHPRWPWQPLRTEHPGEYERAVVPEPDGDEWFHARIVVERPKVSVFVNDASAPCLVVKELSDRSHGSLGLWVGEGSGGHFANLRVTRKR